MKTIIILKQVRESKNLSQNDLARLTGYSLQSIQKIEQGRSKGLNLENLDRLCMALDCEPGDLLKRVEV